jgi:hypothetical protein
MSVNIKLVRPSFVASSYNFALSIAMQPDLPKPHEFKIHA